MAHIVTGRCVDCRYTDCCAVCPVECFWEVTDPAMLVIDPVTCIDCAMCIPECPIYAIYPESEVPEPYQEWIKKNADLFSKGTNITAQTDPLPGAIPLEEIQAREKAKGWDVREPSAVSDAAPAGESGGAATATEAAPPPPPPPGAAKEAAGEKVERAARFESRPSLKVRPGGRIRVGYREGTVQQIRKSRTGSFIDMQILFDLEEKPVWHLYSTLQTMRDQGEVEILDPGPMPGVLDLLFGDTKY